jgi:hypothetical protein
MQPHIQPYKKLLYTAGIISAAITILLSYAYCFTGKYLAHNISIVSIGVNLLTLYVFRKYLVHFNAAPVVITMDWYLCINIAIFLSALFGIFLHNTQNPEFREMLEIMRFFDFLVYCTYMIIGIQLGVRVRRLPNDTGLLRPLSSVLIILIPILFLFVTFFMNVPELRDNRALHIMLTTLAQAPPLLLIGIFYRVINRDTVLLA